MKRRVVTERELRELAAKGVSRLSLPLDAIVTPLARDTAAQLNIALVPGEDPAHSTSLPGAHPAATGIASGHGVVAVGADHGGFELKTQLKEFVGNLGFSVEDVGTSNTEPCDYPDFAFAVGRLVASGRASFGIMVDSVGIGSGIVANKIPGIRAACCTNEVMARSAREHNNANVLTLGSRVIGPDVARAIVREFLSSAFAGGRHEGRVKKITDIDTRYRTLPPS